MKTIVFEAEVEITEAEFKTLKKTNFQMAYNDEVVARVFGKDIKFKRAYVKGGME